MSTTSQKCLIGVADNGCTPMPSTASPRSMQLRLWTAECQRRAPMIHSLTERGVEVVEELTGIRPPRVSKGDPKPETIHHRLEIVRVKLVFDAAASKIGLKKPQWILEQDRDPMASIELPPSQRRVLYHGFKDPPACTCQRDSACRLSIPKDVLGTESVAQFFRFTTSQELSKSTSAAMTSPIWQATDGKRREIIRLPAST